ncbi:MAG: bifunctional DNA-formamidopyrimidine glycosylase/DNA-(apurinic or apyrimidinic site) lyase [Porticoccaceae bacterium]|nr:bifunctional DNA-formamidopyrimidine glycosylase/DNA-(apurinic or apyrimidinic site) lyase [Porticoccaceae bacterium]
MPELPEVETTLRGIAPYLQGQTVTGFIVRNPRLRYPVAPELAALVTGATVGALHRRGKYLLLDFNTGHLLIHLGMSGSLRLVLAATPPGNHDHIDLLLASGQALRYTDPRRFGLWLWHEGDPAQHSLIRHLGPEPLGDDFTPQGLWQRSRGKRVAVKSFIMDSQVVVGVGNIYANEALYLAGIHPQRAAGRISLQRYSALHDAIRGVLTSAIAQGGTTLRDFVGGDGKPGYFSQSLSVYGRGGEPCLGCGSKLREVRLGQRTTVYCPQCQR